MLPIRRSQLVWVRIAAGTTSGKPVPFPDVPDLRGAMVTAMLALDDSFLTFTPDGLPVVPVVNSPDYLVTMYDGSDARHQLIPLRQLATFYNAGLWSELEPFAVDWQKSRVQFQGAAAVAADVAVPFVVHYFYPDGRA